MLVRGHDRGVLEKNRRVFRREQATRKWVIQTQARNSELDNGRTPSKRRNRRPRRRRRIPAYVVEMEYGAGDDAEEKQLGAQGIALEAKRRKEVVEMLAGAVYGYLKRKGLLAAQPGHDSDGKILEEQLDYTAPATGTCNRPRIGS